MNIHGFKTVDSFPMLFHPEMDLLIVSDLHLGLESSMTSKGSYVPAFQLDQVKEELEDAKQETGASRLLVNGDLKNEFRTSYSERDEIKEFLGFVERIFEKVILVGGNHDTMVDDILEDELRDYHLENDILFIHGDSKPPEVDYKTLVIGHEHPALKLEDEIGVSEKVDAFLYGETDEGKNLVVMPAYSIASNGSNVNRMPERELLSPVLREMTDIGTLKAVAVSREAGLFEFPELDRI